MTALDAIEILKTDTGCYECTFGCSTPYECTNSSCPFREAIHLAVERLSIDILPKMIKTEPQTMIYPQVDGITPSVIESHAYEMEKEDK